MDKRVVRVRVDFKLRSTFGGKIDEKLNHASSISPTKRKDRRLLVAAAAVPRLADRSRIIARGALVPNSPRPLREPSVRLSIHPSGIFRSHIG